MSRIGKKPINIDKDVTATIKDNLVQVVGPKGNLEIVLSSSVKAVMTNNQIEVKLNNKKAKNLHGLFRSLIQNALIGVKDGWSKTLELIGVGFRAQTSGDKLTLHLGFSHPIEIEAPVGITFQVKGNKIRVSGADKYLVGEVAAKLRRIRPAEPYKGKGIRYEGEYIRRKAGKAAKAVGGVGTK